MDNQYICQQNYPSSRSLSLPNYPQNYPQNYQQINLSNVNPKTLDSKTKTSIINQNISHSSNGLYKICPIMNSIRFPYKNTYDPGSINSICKWSNFEF